MTGKNATNRTGMNQAHTDFKAIVGLKVWGSSHVANILQVCKCYMAMKSKQTGLTRVFKCADRVVASIKFLFQKYQSGLSFLWKQKLWLTGSLNKFISV